MLDKEMFKKNVMEKLNELLENIKSAEAILEAMRKAGQTDYEKEYRLVTLKRYYETLKKMAESIK